MRVYVSVYTYTYVSLCQRLTLVSLGAEENSLPLKILFIGTSAVTHANYQQ